MSKSEKNSNKKILLIIFIVTIVSFTYSQFMINLTDFSSPTITALFNLIIAICIAAIVYFIILLFKKRVK